MKNRETTSLIACPSQLYSFRGTNVFERTSIQEPHIIKGLHEQGFMGIEVPEKYGGAGMSFTAVLLMVEELSKVDAAVAAGADVHNTLVNNMFNFYANDAIKEKFLTRLATDTVGSFCLTEPGSGSDAFSLATKAQDLGKEGFRINGSKLWITNAGDAEIFVVFANVDPSKGHKGILSLIHI